jgi:hypothetical protein
VWGQSAVWQPQGATSGSIYYNGGNVGIGTTSASFPLTVSTGTDRVLNFRGDPTSFGWSSALGGPILESVNSAQNNIVPMTFAASTFNFLVGNVGIGTTNPCATNPPANCKLSVAGGIQAQEVVVNTGWSDYVFQPDYHLRPLREVAAYIRENHHLPDIPTEAEVKENGVSLGDMQAKLLAKVEELTLHMIELEHENSELKQSVRKLQETVPQPAGDHTRHGGIKR